jgi:general nucleoside transport system permease protein
MDALLAIFDASLLISTIRLVSPILLAALGGMFTQRAGIFNIALEGLMLIGSFFAIAGVYWTGNAYVGVISAVVAASAVALVLGFVVIDLRGNAIVAGLALNIFALGFTTYLMRPVFGVSGGSYYDPRIHGLPNVDLPILADIPFIGPVISGYSILVYLAVLAVPLSYVLLFKHPLGLHIRAVGEDPIAAGSVGVNVRRIRYLTVLLSGALCGLAGAQLSISLVTQFVQGMTAGRGFIALVAVMFGRAHPIGVLLGSLLFGFAYALTLRLQGVGVPPQFVAMLPYVATIVVLILVQRRAARRSASAPEAIREIDEPMEGQVESAGA